jgi:hypothetical protein
MLLMDLSVIVTGTPPAERIAMARAGVPPGNSADKLGSA